MKALQVIFFVLIVWVAAPSTYAQVPVNVSKLSGDENQGTPGKTKDLVEARSKDDHVEHEGEDQHDEHAGENHAEHEGEDKHDEHGSEPFGKGMAIEDVTEEGSRFRLSESATKLLNIQTQSLGESSQDWFQLPPAALVQFQKNQAVYLWRDRWAKIVLVKAKRDEEGHWWVQAPQLQANSQIVVSGSALLRIAHLQASGQGGKGHAH